jgi:hypothetical protein
VNVYVESNFVLQLALLQEFHANCDAIVKLCEAGRAQLVIPAFSLIEPYRTLGRHHAQRVRIKGDLDIELRQLARTSSFTERLAEPRRRAGRSPLQADLQVRRRLALPQPRFRS